jgi:IclR family acetate operon transcriptional repressor
MAAPRGKKSQSAEPNAPPRVAAVQKAAELLSSFTPTTPAWSLSDLARHLQLPKSTAYNILQTLKDFDLVHQDTRARLYRLGPRSLELGLTYARSNDLLARARTVLNRLVEISGETAKLGVLSSNQVLILAAVESPRQLHTRGDLGTRWHLHSSSLGKAILSALPPAEVAAILETTGLPRFTPSTLDSLPAIEHELAQIRSRGYSLDLEENEPGVCCVAAPLPGSLNGAAAAISVSGPTARLDELALNVLGRHVAAAARSIQSL